jgi:hypothetical protein
MSTVVSLADCSQHYLKSGVLKNALNFLHFLLILNLVKLKRNVSKCTQTTQAKSLGMVTIKPHTFTDLIVSV